MPKVPGRRTLAALAVGFAALSACSNEPAATLGPAPSVRPSPKGPDLERFCELSEEFVLRMGKLDFGRRSREEVKRVFRGIIDRTEATTQEAAVVAPEEIAEDYRETVEAAVRVAESGDIAELRRPAVKNVLDFTDRECG